MKHTLKINVDGFGVGTILLDGKNISELVSAIGINTDVGKPNEVTLVVSNVDIELAADIEDVNLVERKLIEPEPTGRGIPCTCDWCTGKREGL